MSLKRAGLLIVGLFISIRLSVWALMGNCTALAPDEQGYFQTFQWVNNSRESRPTLHWAGTPEWVLHLFFIPAKFLTLAGIPEFTAFRLQSIFLAVLTTLIIILGLRQSRVYSRILNLEKRTRITLIFFLSLTLLMPSHLIWTILGLREPFIYLSVGLILISFGNYLNSTTIYSPWILVLFIGLVLLGYTKFYLLIIISASICLASLILANKTKMLKKFIVFVVVLAIVPVFSDKFSEVNWPTIQFSGVDLTLDILPDFSKPQLPSVTLAQLVECRKSGTTGPITGLGLRFAESFFLERSQLVLSQPPIGEPSATALSNDENLRGSLNFVNLPVGLFSFLLFPLSVLDSGLFGLLGLAEVIFWFPLYVLLGIHLLRSRRLIIRSPLLLASLSFIVLFSVFSALSEVNFGTALRHRSVLLIPMVLAALTSWSNKPFDSKGRQNGNHHPFS
jgi:hypothetical protein